jgi:RimJ/RimL family protein N-acetyltransferase
MEDRDELLAAWPLLGLRVRTPMLELRYPTDDHLIELMALADDVHDPGFQPFMQPWAQRPSPERERGVLQYLWRQRAELTPAKWALPLAVVVDGRIVGIQELGATEFPVTGSVSSGSWVHRPRQGQGIGTEMRAAILHLGFAGLGATRAETGSFAGNTASLRVTEKLGYRPNGDAVHVVDSVRTVEHRFVLTREEWEQGHRDDIDIVGLDPCRPLLGCWPLPAQ